jgi:hypothetical protein
MWTAGTRLGSVCRPPAFEHILDNLNGYMPTLNRPMTLYLISKTNPAAAGSSPWMLEMQGPNSTAAVLLGAMQYWPDSGQADNVTYFAWRVIVPARYMSKVSALACLERLAWAAHPCTRLC